ncbi:MAG: pilin [Candidatus Uhrbacteria bacterium]
MRTKAVMVGVLLAFIAVGFIGVAPAHAQQKCIIGQATKTVPAVSGKSDAVTTYHTVYEPQAPACATAQWYKDKCDLSPNSAVCKGKQRPWLIPDPCCACCGECGLEDFVSLGVGVTKFIFSLIGSLALLMFVIGGFWWLTSGGKADMVKKGKDTIMYAVVGLVIVFSAWVIVNFIIASLTNQKITGTNAVKLFSGSAAIEWAKPNVDGGSNCIQK